MITRQAWDEGPHAKAPKSPLEVPPTPPPKDDNYVPRRPESRQLNTSFPVRTTSIRDGPGAANGAVRPPLSRYSTYIDPEQPQFKLMATVAPGPNRRSSLRREWSGMSQKVTVTTSVTAEFSPLPLRKYASLDQMNRTSTYIEAGPNVRPAVRKPSLIMQMKQPPTAPILQQPPIKANSSRKRMSVVGSQLPHRRSSSQPPRGFEQQYPQWTRNWSASQSTHSLVTASSKPHAVHAISKPAEPESEDSDSSSIRSSSSYERSAAKSTRSSSLTISDPNITTAKLNIGAVDASLKHAGDRTSTHATQDSASYLTALPKMGLARSRRSSTSSLPKTQYSWGSPPAVPFFPATAALHRTPNTTYSPQDISTTRTIAISPIPPPHDRSMSTQVLREPNRLQKTKRITKSTPILRDAPLRADSRMQDYGDAAAKTPKTPKTPRLPYLSSLSGVLRKGRNVISPPAVTPEPIPTLPALKRISLHAQGASIASTLSHQPLGASYSATCTSDGRTNERRWNKRKNKIAPRVRHDSQGKIVSVSNPGNVGATSGNQTSQYKPGLKPWNEEEFMKWEAEEDAAAAAAALDEQDRPMTKLINGLKRGGSVIRSNR